MGFPEIIIIIFQNLLFRYPEIIEIIITELLFIFHFWGKIFFTLYVLVGLVVRWYGPEYIEPADSIFLLFTYLEGMIEGAILVLIFLTPMKNLFKSVKGYL